MFFVLLAGTIVTKTNSGRGCGDDWPLCNGRFIPAYTLESMIEWSHRFISGIVGILVVAAFVLVWMQMRARKDAIFHATMALVFTIIQAILGAMAVVWPQSDAVLAIHFGISLIAFASTLLLVVAVRRKNDQLPVVTGVYSAGYRALNYFSVIFCYIVVYLGAYVRHTESFGGCPDWPLCNGQIIPELTGATGIAFIHRLAALAMLILIVWLSVWTMRITSMPGYMRTAAKIAIISIILQVLSGGLVTFALGDEDIFIFTALIHNMIIGALFSVQCYMAIEVWRSVRKNTGYAVKPNRK
jgi:cytochrome c oxidase assembly protein subunit 15